ncbi:hypothetical protein H4S08_001448 [Coemansia sp. RSA 1365]|nr:hypothetical protein H4S08_001448 [Coemansia sp. RSA 1365]
MSSSPGHRRRRRSSGSRRRSVSPSHAEARRRLSRSRSREKRQRRRSKTIPTTARAYDDCGSSSRRSRQTNPPAPKPDAHRASSRSEKSAEKHTALRREPKRYEPRKPSSSSPEKPQERTDLPSKPSPDPPPQAPKQTRVPDQQSQSKDPATPAQQRATRAETLDTGVPTPDFRLSGKLAAETNTVNGVEVKYTEPDEARRPYATRWRVYVFKNGKDTDMHHVDSASAFLFGRDRRVADIPIDHPSCSSQHAVLQYRHTTGSVKPYLIDLASTNGTFLNGQQIPELRYVELRSEDVIRFGFSTREYVLLCE